MRGTESIVSQVIGRTTPLVNGSTWISKSENNDYTSGFVYVLTDQPGILYIDFSFDGETFFTFKRSGFESIANLPNIHYFIKGPRHIRIRFLNNSGNDQTTFYGYVMYGPPGLLNSPLDLTISGSSDAITTRTDNEHSIMLGRVSGQYIINKYGRNTSISSGEDICDSGGVYAGFPTGSAENFSALSDDPNDTIAGSGAQIIRIFYYDDNTNMFDETGGFLYVDVEMNGVTPVDSGVSGTRVWRVKVIQSGASQANEGNITVRHITTTTNVFTIIQIGEANSEISNFTIPLGYVGYLKRYEASFIDKSTNNEAVVGFRVRDFGTNTFRIIRPTAFTEASPLEESLYGGEMLEELSDFVMRITSLGTGSVDITCNWSLHLVKI